MTYKKILTIILALVMLIGSATPVVAETRGDPVVTVIGDDSNNDDNKLIVAEDPNDKLIPAEDPNDKLIPAEMPGGSDPIVPGGNNGKAIEDWQGKGDWTRPYNTEMGLDKNGKNIYTTNPGGPGFGDSYTYQQWAAIMLNWAGVKYHPHLYGNQGGTPGTGTDKKTGQTVFIEPKIQYDVIVVDADKNIQIYSGFGYRGWDAYTSVFNRATKELNFDISKSKIDKIDTSQYFQNLGEKFYYDTSYANGKGGSTGTLFDANPMGTIKVPARIYLVDYSEINGDSSVIFKDDDFQVGGFRDEGDKAKVAKNPKRLNVLNRVESGKYNFSTSDINAYTWGYMDVDESFGERIVTYVNRSIYTPNLKDKDIGSPINSRGFVPISTSTNTRTKGSNFAVGKTKDSSKTLISDWFYQTYSFELEKAPKIKILKIEPKDPPKPPQNPPQDPPQDPPQNPPQDPPELPPETNVEINVEVGYPDDDPEGDKSGGDVKKPTDPVKPPKKKKPDKPAKDEKPITPVVDVEIKPDDPNGEKSKNTVKSPEAIKRPDKKKVKVPVKVKTGKAGSTIEVCAKINPKTFEGLNQELTEEQKKEYCQKFKVGKAADIGISADAKASGQGVDVSKGTFKKGSQITVNFKAKHFEGLKTVGTGDSKDPKINVIFEVKDDKGNVVNKSNQEVGPLAPKQEIPLKPLQFTANGEFFTACAKIDPKHEKLGQNIKNGNDEVCISLNNNQEEIKNYAVRDVMITPTAVTLKSGESSRRENVQISFGVANESRGNKQLPSGLEAKIYVNGRVVKTTTISVAPGTTKTHTESIPITLQAGSKNPTQNTVEVRVNERRNPKEETPGRDPYADNKASNVIHVFKFLDGCPKNRSQYQRGVNKENKDFNSNIDYKVDFKTSGYVTYRWTKVEEKTKTVYPENYDFPCLRRGTVQERNPYYNPWVAPSPWNQPFIEKETCLSADTSKGKLNWDGSMDVPYTVYTPKSATRFIKDRNVTSNFNKNVRFEEKINAKPMFRSKLTYDLVNPRIPLNQRNDDNTKGWVPLQNAKIKNGTGFEIKYEYTYDLKTKNNKTLNGQVSIQEAKNQMSYSDAQRELMYAPIPNDVIQLARADKAYPYASSASVSTRNYIRHSSRNDMATLLGDGGDTEVFANIPKVTSKMKDKNCIRLDEYKSTNPQRGDTSSVRKKIDFRLPSIKNPQGKNERKIFTMLPSPGKASPLVVTMRETRGFQPGYPKKPLKWQWEEGAIDIKANDDIKVHVIR